VLWEKASPASLHHPYLVEKGIEPHGVRENSDGQLLVPVWIDGKVTSLETIAADGGKLFLTGGCVSGGSHLIGEPGDKIAVAEGFATAATIHEMTGLAVAVAFCRGNLLPVARTIRAKYPTAKIVFAADDDFRTERKTGENPGIRDARSAARAIGAEVAIPPFDLGGGETGTDWNDFAAAQGEAAAKAAFNVVAERVDKASNGEQ
jgi:putative DNA primase/helicase